MPPAVDYLTTVLDSKEKLYNFHGFIPKLGFFARLYLYIINIAYRNSESLFLGGAVPGVHSVPFFLIKDRCTHRPGAHLRPNPHYIELYDNKRSGTLEAFFPKWFFLGVFSMFHYYCRLEQRSC